MNCKCNTCGRCHTDTIPKTLKVLAIGNSFSQDAMEHLYLVAKDMGIENILLGNLYIGGCSLQRHLRNMKEDLGEYTFFISDEESCGMITEGECRTAEYGITYTDWDYITVQQASNYSGIAESFSYLDDIISYVNSKKISDSKLLWHMTWAYQQDSAHSGFVNYNTDQMTMYNSIVSAVREIILTNGAISGVIPSGTAIQNLRTSALGDTLTRDGFHLSLGIGRYTAALTWLAYITGCDVDPVTAYPEKYPEVADNLDYIKDAVKRALSAPLSVTEMK